MRPPTDDIPAPPFPLRSRWLNSEPLDLYRLNAGPLLVEFFDVCRVNSLRTLPYVKSWHERYASLGLTVVSVHSPGFRPSANEDFAASEVERLGVAHPVVLDTDFGLWHDYENAGWPARYLFDSDHLLADYHYGEGAYVDTERAIQALLGAEAEREPIAPLRPEDVPDAPLEVPTPDRTESPWDGDYAAGGVWGVLEGSGSATVNGTPIEIERAGVQALVEHPHHTEATLTLELAGTLRCYGVCFTAGLRA